MSASPAEIATTDGATTSSQLYVLNLCASTSPMALSQPSTPALKRYTFFVSRQRDDGRERFRLHMGYFATQEDAELLLDVVRDVYPAAWAGPAPTSGVPRRNRVVVAPAPVAAKPVPQPMPQPMPQPAAPVPATSSVAARAEPEAQPPARPDVLDAMSNVRDVIAQLGETSTRLATLKDDEKSGLCESEVLHVLETAARSAASPASASPVSGDAARETQPQAEIQGDAESTAASCFAVQLVWAVSPIDAARLPHLAIFDAYTLYNVEGSRDGRKWYGVRLGFFSDPGAASQVANYVRSDYRAVAVVPVATKERDGAGGGGPVKAKRAAREDESPKAPAAPAVAAPALVPEGLNGFELLADDRPAPIKQDIDDKPARKPQAQAAVPVAQPVAQPQPRVPGKPTGKPVGKRAVARKRPPMRPGAANPLESTLEILGASTLTLEEGRTIIDDSVVRQPLDRKPAGRFAKLLGRLSGQ
jgi:hypothetical protein